jgi:hypothetical protein
MGFAVLILGLADIVGYSQMLGRQLTLLDGLSF